MSPSKSHKSFSKILFQKEIILVSLSAFFVMLNFYIMLNLVPLYIVHQGGTEFTAGVQNAVLSIAAVALRFYFGPLIDAKGPKHFLLIGSFVFATSPLLTWITSNYFLQILVRIYYAIGTATFLATASSAVSRYAPAEYRGRVIGIYRAILSFALMIGPSLGLKIISGYTYGTLFVFCSIICLVGFILVFNLPNEKGKDLKNTLKVKEVMLNTLDLLKKPELLRAYLGIVIISLSTGVLFTYLSIYTLDYSSIKNPGIYFTIYAGIGVITTTYSGYLSDRIGRDKVIIPAIVCLGIGLASLSLLASGLSYIFYISAVLSGIGYSASLTALITSIIDNSEEKIRTTALSMQENAIDISMAFGAFVFGLCTTKFHMSYIFLIFGIVTFIAPFGLSRIKATNDKTINKTM